MTKKRIFRLFSKEKEGHIFALLVKEVYVVADSEYQARFLALKQLSGEFSCSDEDIQCEEVCQDAPQIIWVVYHD